MTHLMRSVIAGLLFLSVPVWGIVACERGSYEYNGGCVLDIQPEQAVPVKPSNEKPPKSGLPSWQAADAKVLMPPSLADQDVKEDMEKIDATKQGKAAAGLK